MLAPTLLLVAGLVVLTIAGHLLVEGAVRVALLARVTATVVGLTVVAMGTSLPELAVSVGAALEHATDIAYGNVIGSNIFNIAVILAVAALVHTIPVPGQTIRLEYPFMVVASFVVLLLARDGVVDRLEGVFLVVALVSFVAYVVRLARQATAPDDTRELAERLERTVARAGGRARAWRISAVMVALGIVGLGAGAEMMVRGAVTIAEAWGISQRVIGLTIVAMGTSLPELATCVVAAARKEPDILLGNLVGSNIFNVLGILGIASLITDVRVHPAAIAVDNWVMLGFAVVLFPPMAWGRSVTWRNGLFLLTGFVAYVTYLAVTTL
ncbi:MAG: calcium/sodium antiporter [Gemmatimonadota bacterium]|nr:calcium/sodium antiporter [Gemmatimonadota bacterium]